MEFRFVMNKMLGKSMMSKVQLKHKFPNKEARYVAQN